LYLATIELVTLEAVAMALLVRSSFSLTVDYDKDINTLVWDGDFHSMPHIPDITAKQFPIVEGCGKKVMDIQIVHFPLDISYGEFLQELNQSSGEFTDLKAFLALAAQSREWRVEEERKRSIHIIGPDLKRKDGLRGILWFSLWKSGSYSNRGLHLGLCRMDDKCTSHREFAVISTISTQRRDHPI